MEGDGSRATRQVALGWVFPLALCLSIALPAELSAPLHLRASPRIGFEPVTLTLTLTVAPHPLNTAWCIAVEETTFERYSRVSCERYSRVSCERYSRVSCEEIRAQDRRRVRTYSLRLPFLLEGDYDTRAYIYRVPSSRPAVQIPGPTVRVLQSLPPGG